jgi:superfamily I DNA/RNA helicase
MSQFKFNTISRTDIESSLGGAQMLRAIDYDGPNNLLITGCAGSGKTTVNIMRAERLVILGKNILVVTYQDLLWKSLVNIASVRLSSKIFKFYTWYTKKSGAFIGNKSDLEMLEDLNQVGSFDEIIVDEGQNFERKIHKVLLQKALKYTVGADNAQRVYDNGLTAGQIREEIENKGDLLPVPLEYNYRNTHEIYNFARYFVPFNERANNNLSINKIPKGKGDKPTVFLVPDDDTRLAQLQTLLKDAGDRNAAVLVYSPEEVDLYKKIITDFGLSCSAHHSKSHVSGNIENILVTTFQSAQGLEFQVVIMPTMETARNTRNKKEEHYYVACTRAKENLFLISRTENLPDYMSTFDVNSYTLIRSMKKKLPPKIVIANPYGEEDDLPF